MPHCPHCNLYYCTTGMMARHIARKHSDQGSSMHHSWTNLHLIRTFTKQGHPPDVVMRRCCEHLGWQGPHPHLWEVQMIMSTGCRSTVAGRSLAAPVDGGTPTGSTGAAIRRE